MFRILDIGCGPNSKLSSKYLEIEITRADRQRYEATDVQDMEKLSYPDKSFDLVTCINALDHTKDAKSAIKEMIRVCSGLIYIDCALIQHTQSGGHHFWDALEDGTFTSKNNSFNLKDFGFSVELTDNGAERRYNHVTFKRYNS